MKKLLISLLLVLWASVSGAQIVNTEGSFIAAGGTLSGCSIYSFVYVDVNGNLACALTPVNGSVSTAGRSILTIRDTISGSSATSNFLNITGTFPASISTNNSGVYISTTNGGDAGNSDEYGLFSTIGGALGASSKYHVGTFGQSTSTSSGVAVGAAGEAFFNSSSEYALGVYGGATSVNGNTGINVGSVSFAGSNGAAPTAILGSWGEVGNTGTSRIGGFFRLGATGYSTSLGGVSLITAPPTGVAALVADNGAQAANIFEARDNGTAVFTLGDGGAATVGGGTWTWGGGYTIAQNGNTLFNNQSANTFTTPTNTLGSGYGFYVGASNGGRVHNITDLTPDAPTLLTGTVSNSWHVFETADVFDFNNGRCGTSACTSPAIIIHSPDQVTTEYAQISTDTTGAAGFQSNFAELRVGGTKTAITEGAPQPILRIAIAGSTSLYGATVFYTVYDINGTNYVTRAGQVRVQGGNSSGAIVCTINAAQDTEAEDGSQIATSAAYTLTYTWTNVVNGSNCDLSLNAASSAGVNTYGITWTAVVTGNSSSITVVGQ